MKSLVIYATKTGFTAECVDRLVKLLSGQIDTIRLTGRPPSIDLAAYGAVMIGGSIQAGRIQKVVKKFCESHAAELITKKLGLFISCLTPPAKADHYFEESFPRSLVVHASAKACFGGAAQYDRMGALDRFIIKKISGQAESFSKPNDTGIENFAKAMT